LLPTGVGLDLGGIAKGWTVQQTAHRLGRLGPALVDAGGDIACVGAPPTGSAWLVGMADPHRPEADLGALALTDEAVATSSLTGRRWQYHGQTAHHLIDPRTGAPAHTDLASVTVVAPRLPDAEIHAKVALILGRVEGWAYLNKQPNVSALLVTATGDQLSCGSLEEKAYVYSPAFAKTFLTLV
jgi:thiamine biosynthesis lipoprotein